MEDTGGPDSIASPQKMARAAVMNIERQRKEGNMPGDMALNRRLIDLASGGKQHLIVIRPEAVGESEGSSRQEMYFAVIGNEYEIGRIDPASGQLLQVRDSQIGTVLKTVTEQIPGRLPTAGEISQIIYDKSKKAVMAGEGVRLPVLEETGGRYQIFNEVLAKKKDDPEWRLPNDYVGNGDGK